jgi:hypothetical protein
VQFFLLIFRFSAFSQITCSDIPLRIAALDVAKRFSTPRHLLPINIFPPNQPTKWAEE